MKKLFYFVILLGIFTACNQQKNTQLSYEVDPFNKEVVVGDILETSAYTYLFVNEKSQQYWIAVTKTQAEIGKTYYFSEAMEMKDFHSKELDRTFDVVFFVGNLSNQPIPARPTAASPSMTMPSAQSSKTPPMKQDVKIEPIDGSIPLVDLFEKSDSFAGKTIKVVGKVTKFNASIMGRNWVHIQDGTGNDEFFDLTITTQDEVNVGDVVIFEGVITLKKDLGSGYFFQILMEEAKASKLSLQ